MKPLIKKILREQNDRISDVTPQRHYDHETNEWVDTQLPTQSVFFHAVKATLKILRELQNGDDSPVNRAWDMRNVLKLFGLMPPQQGVADKIYWAAVDNEEGMLDGSIKNYDELYLRPLKTYKAKCSEQSTEYVEYMWEPIVSAYSEKDARESIYEDEDGYYAWWEWDNKPGFDKSYGDTETDGKEIDEIVEINDTPSHPQDFQLNEESDLINESKIILKAIKQKAKNGNQDALDYLKDIYRK